MTDRHDLLLVCNPGGTSVGASLQLAAQTEGHAVKVCDALQAFANRRLFDRLSWRFFGHRPAQLGPFTEQVVATCAAVRPTILLTTGLAPVRAPGLATVGNMGMVRVNYLTDDPWNPTCRSNWFFDALLEYDHIFSPRRANLADLRAHGCKNVHYLPFAYDPSLWVVESPENDGRGADVVFVGGADNDRVPILASLGESGIRLDIYGAYWSRYRETRAFHRGQAGPEVIRNATRSAKIALCLVRRANRDGHVMRSFEIAAIGGACMLVESTEEHRELFGPEGECVVYFQDNNELIDKVRWLLEHEEERTRLAAHAHARIVDGTNTYADRLRTMLEMTLQSLKPGA